MTQTFSIILHPSSLYAFKTFLPGIFLFFVRISFMLVTIVYCYLHFSFVSLLNWESLNSRVRNFDSVHKYFMNT